MFDLPPCVDDISAHYQVPKMYIAGILKTEGGKVGDKILNTNGTYDLGPMQINTWWLEDHSRSLTKIGITEHSLRFNYCQNIAVGTYIFKKNVMSYSSIKRALSAYNTGDPNGSTSYPKKVFSHICRLFGEYCST